jgi:uncharacterized protein
VTLSIIIPSLHDGPALQQCLQRLCMADPRPEILIADGSAAQDCLFTAQHYGVRHIPCPVVGRGPQLRYAGNLAHGEILIFHHADTELTPAHLQAVHSHFSTHPLSRCGAFFRDFAWQYPHLAWLTPSSRRWQEEMSILYGDQTQFFRSQHYFQLGGYPEYPLMEDVAMSDRMRAAGGLVLLDPPIRTSLRRFQQKGWWRTKLMNLAYIIAYRCGVSPRRLYAWYYAGE